MAAISQEKASCTDVCVGAVDCGLATAAGGGLFIGAIGIWVVSGMVTGMVVCGNTGSVEMASEKSGDDSATVSATGD
jgi:hypothetical protein